MTCPDYDDEHTDSTGDYGYGDDEKTTDDDHSYGDDDECSDSTDSDTPSGTDAADGSDGGDAKLVPNLKLKAIRNIKSQAMNSQTSLSEWTTSAQSIPLAAGTSGSSVTIAGGKSIESLKTALSDNGIWDSPAAEDYSSRITFAIDSIGTVFDTIVTNLTDAENAQVASPGEEVEPDSPEAGWRASP
ncbi:MAG: hypothetical protein ACFNME_03380 [Actinomyces dentalis]|jgi:hypothetical protein